MTTMDIKLAIQKCKAQKTVTLAMAVMLTFAPGAAALAGTFQIIGGSQAVSPGAGTYVYATHATEPYVKSSAHTAATQTTTATSSKYCNICSGNVCKAVENCRVACCSGYLDSWNSNDRKSRHAGLAGNCHDSSERVGG